MVEREREKAPVAQAQRPSVGALWPTILLALILRVSLFCTPASAAGTYVRPGSVGEINFEIQNESDSAGRIDGLTVTVSAPVHFRTQPTSELGPLSAEVGRSVLFTVGYEITDNAPEGEFDVSLRAVSDDEMDPEALNATAKLVVDATPPRISVFGDDFELISGGITQSMQVVVVGEDDGSGLGSISVRRAAGAPPSEQNLFGQAGEALLFPLDRPWMSDDEYIARVEDRVGNVSEIHFTVQRPPIASVLFSRPGGERGSAFFGAGPSDLLVPEEKASIFIEDGSKLESFKITRNGITVLDKTYSDATTDTALLPASGNEMPSGLYVITAKDITGETTTMSFRKYRFLLEVDQAASSAHFDGTNFQYTVAMRADTEGAGMKKIEIFNTEQDNNSFRRASTPIYTKTLNGAAEAAFTIPNTLSKGVYVAVGTDVQDNKVARVISLTDQDAGIRLGLANSTYDHTVDHTGAVELALQPGENSPYYPSGTVKTPKIDLRTGKDEADRVVFTPLPGTLGTAVREIVPEYGRTGTAVSSTGPDAAPEPGNQANGMSITYASENGVVVKAEDWLGDPMLESPNVHELYTKIESTNLPLDFTGPVAWTLTLTRNTTTVRAFPPGFMSPSVIAIPLNTRMSFATVMEGGGETLYAVASNDGRCGAETTAPGLSVVQTPVPAGALPGSDPVTPDDCQIDPILRFTTPARVSLKFSPSEAAARGLDLTTAKIYQAEPGRPYHLTDSQVVDYIGGSATAFVSDLVLDTRFAVFAKPYPKRAPEAVVVVAVSSRSAELAWGANGNGPNQPYSVSAASLSGRCGDAPGPAVTMTAVGTSVNYVPLVPSATYQFTVCNASVPTLCAEPVVAVTMPDGVGRTQPAPAFVCSNEPPPPPPGGGSRTGLAVAADSLGRLWTVGDDNGRLVVGRYGAAGALQVSADLGQHSGSNGGWSIRFDASGNVYVVGNGDGVTVYKLSPDAALLSTKSFPAGPDGQSVASEASGDVWITGMLQQESGPVQLKMGLWKYSVQNDDLSLTATYTRGGPADAGFGVRVLGGKVYVEGYTSTVSLATPSLGAALWVFDGDGHGPISGPFIKPDYLRSLEGDVNAKLEVSDGTLFATAQRTGAAGQSDLALIRYDAQGVELLERYESMGEGVNLSPQGMTVAPNGEIVVAVKARISQESGPAQIAGGVVRYEPDGDFVDAAVDESVNGSLNGLAYLGQDLWLAVDGSTAPHKFRRDTILPAVDVLVSSRAPPPPPPTDTQAPVTALTVNGVPSAGATVDAFATDIFGLSANDAGDAASGVAQTNLKIDAAAYTVYAGTFTLPAGTHTLSFYSTDVAGNAEAEKTVTVNVAPAVSATLALSPDTINLNSNGNSVTAVLEFAGVPAAQADPATFRLSRVNGQAISPLAPLSKPAPKLGDSDEDGIPDWTMKFDRQALIAVLPIQAQAEVTLEGSFTGGGTFQAAALVRTIQPAKVKANKTEEVVHPALGASVELPSGALAKDTEITVTAVAAAPQAEEDAKEQAAAAVGKEPVGKAVEFGPEGTQFAVPVTLELPYDPEELKGAGPEKLVVAYWNPKTSVWEPLPSVVDPKKRVVVAQTTHFSQYQVLAPPSSGGGAAPAAVSDEFGIVDVYAFPNPAKRKNPTIRAQVGAADSVQLRFYDISGQVVHEASVTGWRLYDDGNGKGAIPTFDYAWDVSSVGSGVYLFTVTGKKAGHGDVRTTKRVAVIK